MFRWLNNLVSGSKNVDDFDKDSRGGSKELVSHGSGEFSMARVQANHILEDDSQVEVGTGSTLFVGVYDGHGGHHTSTYIRSHLFENLLRRLQEQNNHDMSWDVLRQAVTDTEEGFMEVVAKDYRKCPWLGTVGSCCLFGFIWRGTLYIANLGDSRVVIASKIRDTRILKAEQLTKDHNCSNEGIRLEVMAKHRDDPNILIYNDKNGEESAQARGFEERRKEAWRIKGIIQISRTIGDAYLKRKPFESRIIFPKLGEVPKPFTRAVLSAEPEILSRVIKDDDMCRIFASHGFWRFMSNENAVLTIERNPKRGIAKRLLRNALVNAAQEGNILYPQLRNTRSRRIYHDDMTVIVVFLNQRHQRTRHIEQMSYTLGRDTNEESLFTSLVNSS